MKSFDYEAVVTPDGDVYCTTCLPSDVREPDCSPIFADSEVDAGSEPVCNNCGHKHDYMNVLDN